MKKFSIIVAVDAEGGIGKDNTLPWHLPADMKHFKEITTHDYVPGRENVVIMGRRTWESLPVRFRPLPGRKNVVISSQEDYPLPAAVLLCQDFETAVQRFCCEEASLYGEIFIIGGEQVFRTAVGHVFCGFVYLTRIEKSFACDRFFPDMSFSSEIYRSPLKEENGLSFYFSKKSL